MGFPIASLSAANQARFAAQAQAPKFQGNPAAKKASSAGFLPTPCLGLEVYTIGAIVIAGIILLRFGLKEGGFLRKLFDKCSGGTCKKPEAEKAPEKAEDGAEATPKS